MLETAENLRRQYNIPREEQDELALRSHQRAVAAWDSGRFDAETVPVPVPSKKGETTLVTRDEHPRADTTLEKLASLRPIRIKQDPEATDTAGNASGENDSAACCIVTSPEKARLSQQMTWWPPAAISAESERSWLPPEPSRSIKRVWYGEPGIATAEFPEPQSARVAMCPLQASTGFATVAVKVIVILADLSPAKPAPLG